MRYSALLTLFFSSAAIAEDLNWVFGNDGRFEQWNFLMRGPCLPMLEEIAANHPVTILVPSNDAVKEFRNGPDFVDYNNNDKLCGLVKYHVIMGTHKSEDLSASGPFLETFLGRSKHHAGAALQTEQETAIDRRGRGVNFYSGLRRKASIWDGNYLSDGTYMHGIDKVLTPPLSFADTAQAAGLSSAVMAATKVNLDWWSDSQVTYFVPTNEAFRQVGSIMNSASDEEIRGILAYHYLNTTAEPVWTSSMETGDVTTAGGRDLMMTLSKAGGFYVNTAKITQHNIITANGVMHIIDHVLNPNNPQSKQKNNSPFSLPAFENAKASGSPPFAGMLTQKSRYHLDPGQPKARIPMGYTDDDPIDTDFVDGKGNPEVDGITDD